MKEHLKSVYESFASIDLVKFDNSSVSEDITGKLGRFDRKILMRDIRESLAAIFVFVLFLAELVLGDHNLLNQIGIVIILVTCPFIAYVLYSTRKFSADNLTLPMKEYLKQQRVYLVKQKMLLDNVLLWYILPLFVGILLSSLPNQQLTWPGEFWSFHVLYPIGLVVFAIILYQLNLKAARAVQPLIDEVDETLQDLEE